MWLDVLKKMKKMSGMTSQQISDETGEPKSTIDKLFSGNTKEPRLTLVMHVVHCMGFSLDELDENRSDTILLSEHEKKIIRAYRQRPEMQDAINTLLNIEIKTKEEKEKKRA